MCSYIVIDRMSDCADICDFGTPPTDDGPDSDIRESSDSVYNGDDGGFWINSESSDSDGSSGSS